MSKLTDEDAQEIRLRYDLGLSRDRLAEEFGVDRTTIGRLIPPDKRRGPGPRTGISARRSDVRDDEVVRLRDVDGLSWAQLGAAVGMTRLGARSRYMRAKRRDQQAQKPLELHAGDSVR